MSFVKKAFLAAAVAAAVLVGTVVAAAGGWPLDEGVSPGSMSGDI
jgi:hypothetical protein